MQTFKSIMIIDDDAFVGPLIADILQNKGFQTHLFESPEKALLSFQVAPEQFDLVISDYTMPQMSGLDLLGMIHDINPAVPLILMSALLPSNIPMHIMALSKPMRLDTLIQIVDMCLEEDEADEVTFPKISVETESLHP